MKDNPHPPTQPVLPLNQTTAPKTSRPERIVQFGEGNFLRAFADWMVTRMNRQTDFNASVVVVQPRAGGAVARLQAQDCLYHVHLQGLSQGQVVDTFELMDCVSRTIDPYVSPTAYQDLAAQPDLRFVFSNTTEAGIAFDPSCRLCDAPAVSFPGKLTQLLFWRYRAFQGDPSKGLILLPCELIFGNGRCLTDCIHQYIDLWQPEMDGEAEGFRRWFDNCCPVCTTLVDRIVPGFPKKDVAELQQRLGYADNQLVQAEPFHLWVIETPPQLTASQLEREFPAARAGLNVVLTSDETPYHTRKVTLLNGPHTVLSPVAFLSGLDIVRQACEHPVVGRFVRRVTYDELLPTLDLPENELRDFAEGVMEADDGLVADEWFPLANLDYYVAQPLGMRAMGLGGVERIHKYAWINDERGGFNEGEDFWFLYDTRYPRDPSNLFPGMFNSVELMGIIPIERGGKTAKNFYVYACKGLKTSALP